VQTRGCSKESGTIGIELKAKIPDAKDIVTTRPVQNLWLASLDFSLDLV
jgi:hypothetical protein